MFHHANHPRRIIVLIFLLACAIGVGVGWQIHRSRTSSEAGRKPNGSSRVHVLALKGVLNDEVIARFEHEHGIRMDVAEADSPESLWDRFESGPPAERFDLVTLFSYQVPTAVQALRVQPLRTAKLHNIASIAMDFRGIPGDLNHERLVPVLWGLTGFLYDTKRLSGAPAESWHALLGQSNLRGKLALLPSTAELARWLPVPSEAEEEGPTTIDVRRSLAPLLSMASFSSSYWSSADLLEGANPPLVVQMNHGEAAMRPESKSGDWKFVLPEDGTSLWILSFALTREAQAESEAYAFLDYLLEAETALALVRATRQASTHSSLETSGLPAQIKPSYLRQVPLTRVLLLRDFSRAREIRALLPTTVTAKKK